MQRAVSPSWGWTAVACGAMIAALLGGLTLIRWLGGALSAPAPTATTIFGSGSLHNAEALPHVLLALIVVIVVARALGTLFSYLHQPAVVGEILAGILLGPSLLGRVLPQVSAYLLPPEVAPFLEILAQVGMILYMFLVGLELDPGVLRERGPATLIVSHASIVMPFLLGGALALWIYPQVASSDVPFLLFALFLGVSMSITAFPVLARILTERRIHKTPMGVTALTCAAINDVVGWCLLAFVVSIVQARVTGALVTLLLAAGYIAVMLLLVRPAMARLVLLYGTKGRLTQGVMAVIFVALLLSALGTHFIGIHAVFGAFLLGAVIPHDSGMAGELTDRLEDLVVVLLLPAFFAFTGLRTQIGLVHGAQQWLLCGAIILVASAGKFGGSLIAGRATGMSWPDATALGVLMNTRGLMELIILNIGLDLRVISPVLFAMLVLMALLTTFATSPLLQLLTRRQPVAAPPPVAPSPEAVRTARQGVLVPISNPMGMIPLLDLAAAATGAADPPPRALALVRRPAGGVRSGLREADHRVLPRAPIIVAAIDHARVAGYPLNLQAVWTDDPATDILQAAAAAQVEWLLLGYHQPVFGGDLLGGVVKQVLDRVAALPIHIGVVIHGHLRPLERVVVVVDDSRDGRAGLSLAMRVANHIQGSLHAVLVPRTGAEPEPELARLIDETRGASTHWLHTDVLEQRTPAQLAQTTRGDLVVIGNSLADELGLPLDDVPGAERCVVVVRGAA